MRAARSERATIGSYNEARRRGYQFVAGVTPQETATLIESIEATGLSTSSSAVLDRGKR